MKNKKLDKKEIRFELIRAMLPHVPFDGWCADALLAGANDCGHDAEAVRVAFPRGATDAIALHSRLADQSMVDAFLELPEKPEKVHLTIRKLVLLRLERAQPDKDAIRRAVSVLAMPVNAKLSAKLLYETVDSMWRAAGQRDTNFSFYTKRGTLAAVYSATMLAWLADNSSNLDKTVGFLDRRLADVAQIPRLTRPVFQFMSAGQRFLGIITRSFAKRHSR